MIKPSGRARDRGLYCLKGTYIHYAPSESIPLELSHVATGTPTTVAKNGADTDAKRDLTLEEMTKYADEFNRQNPSWEWRLVRKERPIR